MLNIYIIDLNHKTKKLAEKLTRTVRIHRAQIYKGKLQEEKKTLKQQLDIEKKQKPKLVTRCRLIRLKLKPRQHQTLLRCFKDARKTYNLVVDDVLKNDGLKLKPNLLEKQLRDKYVTAKGLLAQSRKRCILLITPKVIRQQAVKSLVSSVKTYITKQQKREELRAKYPRARSFKGDVKFHPGFKSCKMTSDSIGIEKVSFKFIDSDHLSLYRI